MSRMKKKLNPILGQILETKVYGYSLVGHKFTFQPVNQIWSLVSSAKPQITNVKKKVQNRASQISTLCCSDYVNLLYKVFHVALDMSCSVSVCICFGAFSYKNTFLHYFPSQVTLTC